MSLLRLVFSDGAYHVDSSFEPVKLSHGENVLGRGTYLGISDARVSRNQAKVVFDQEKGTAELVKTGVNPTKIMRAGSKDLEDAGANTSVALNSGDAILLIPVKDGVHHMFRFEASSNTTTTSTSSSSSSTTTTTVTPSNSTPTPAAPAATVRGASTAAEAAPAPLTRKASSGTKGGKGKGPSRFDAFMAGLSDDEDDDGKAVAAPEKDVGIDIVFCFDTTGSMFPALESVKAKLKETINELFKEINVRVAIIAHGDYGDHVTAYVLKSLDFSTDVGAIVEFVEGCGKTHGYDEAECYEYALHFARRLSWEDNRSKAFVLIGDSMPHQPSFTNLSLNWRTEARALADAGVVIYSVQALKKKNSAAFYEELAESTGGFLLHMEEFDWMPIMFTALCYRQHSPEKFEGFRMKLIWEKKLTHESPLNRIFLEMSTPVINRLYPDFTGHQKMSWWDFSLDDGVPHFYWHPDLNTFRGDPPEGVEKVKRVQKKRKAAGSGSDRESGAEDDSDGSDSRPAKKAKKTRAKIEVEKIVDPTAVYRLTKKAEIKRQLAKWKTDLGTEGMGITVGGEANDTIEAMQKRLEDVIRNFG